MEDKIISETELSPEIVLEISGRLKIRGRSMMEDAALFYRPCLDWVERYIGSRESSLMIEIDLSYFNSSTAKQLLKLLMMVDDSENGGLVRWISPVGNELLKERGEELQAMLDLPFQFIER